MRRFGDALADSRHGAIMPRLIDDDGCRRWIADRPRRGVHRSEEHTSELQSRQYLVCRLLLEKKNDKVSILTAIKEQLGERLTTVFPRQGHYAHAPDVDRFPAPDVTIHRSIGLTTYDIPALMD